MHAVLGALAAILLVAGLAVAGDEKKDHPTSTSRMTECNAEAAEKKLAGDARKQFMSECLKSHAAHEDASATAAASKSAEGKHNGQAEKMKTCNQEAAVKGLHGDERRQFMSQCLKGEKKS